MKKAILTSRLILIDFLQTVFAKICRVMSCNNIQRLYKPNSFQGLPGWHEPLNVTGKILMTLFILNLPGTYASVQGQRLSRDLEIGLLTNQVGYLPSSTKTCLVRRSEKTNFDVVEITSGQVAYRGTLIPRQGDFGMWATADFSSVVTAGR